MRCLLCQEDIMVGEHFGLEYKNYIHAKTGINIVSDQPMCMFCENTVLKFKELERKIQAKYGSSARKAENNEKADESNDQLPPFKQVEHKNKVQRGNSAKKSENAVKDKESIDQLTQFQGTSSNDALSYSNMLKRKTDEKAPNTVGPPKTSKPNANRYKNMSNKAVEFKKGEKVAYYDTEVDDMRIATIIQRTGPKAYYVGSNGKKFYLGSKDIQKIQEKE